MTNEEIIQRGEHAQRLLGDKMLNEALDSIEQAVVQEWENCPARDKEGREELWMYYKTSKKFRGVLLGAIDSMKIAQHEQKSLIERSKDKIRSLVR